MQAVLPAHGTSSRRTIPHVRRSASGAGESRRNPVAW